ncbi:hypothetical protein ACVIU7_009389 [Bradyrhizobium liaoningense]
MKEVIDYVHEQLKNLGGEKDPNKLLAAAATIVGEVSTSTAAEVAAEASAEAAFEVAAESSQSK